MLRARYRQTPSRPAVRQRRRVTLHLQVTLHRHVPVARVNDELVGVHGKVRGNTKRARHCHRGGRQATRDGHGVVHDGDQVRVPGTANLVVGEAN